LAIGIGEIAGQSSGNWKNIEHPIVSGQLNCRSRALQALILSGCVRKLSQLAPETMIGE
jgi:hypothetical protein